jgi:acyl-homoserine lactone acylase PvdQ
MNDKSLTRALDHLSKLSYPNLGMGFASVDGEIGYLAAGRLVHKAGNPDDGAYVKEGWTGQNEWIHFVGIEETLRMIDPPKGFFALANNKFVHPDNKYHLGWNTNPTARGRRIHNQIQMWID